MYISSKKEFTRAIMNVKPLEQEILLTLEYVHLKRRFETKYIYYALNVQL